jgi:large-conductance mechanosensitive channel
LDVGDLVRRETILVQRDLRHLQKLEEPQLARQQEKQAPPRFPSSCGSAHAVDVVARVVWGVELDDPVDFGDVETTGGDVCAEERALVSVAEFEERVCPFLLLLLALICVVRFVNRLRQRKQGEKPYMQVEHGDVDIVKQLAMVLHRLAAGEENDDLLLEVLAEKRKEEEEALVAVADDIALF